MQGIFKRLTVPTLVAVLLAIQGCGENGGGDPDTPVADVSGSWSITETMGSNTCGEAVGDVVNYAIQVKMSGNSVTVVSPAGTFSGTIDGNKIEWTGSYPEDGGTTSILSMNIKVSNDGNSLGGTTSWRWTDGGITCSGSTSVSGNRTSGPRNGIPTGSESEPNNNASDANWIASGSYAGSLNSSQDEVDFFVFPAPASASVKFTLNWVSSMNDLDLYAGSNLVDCESAEAVSTAEYCVLDLTAGEEVEIKLVGWDTGGSDVSYRLTIE